MTEPTNEPMTVEERGPEDGRPGRLLIFTQNAGDPIAELHLTGEIDEEEQRANATAFAASPMLVEVARQAIRVLKNNPHAIYGGPALLIEARRALKEAKLAEDPPAQTWTGQLREGAAPPPSSGILER